MNNIEFLIYVFLGFKGLEIIFFKYNVYNKIENAANAIKNKLISRFIYLLSQCKFCLDFWASYFVFGLLLFFNGFDLELIYFLFPFFSAALNSILTTLNNR